MHRLSTYKFYLRLSHFLLWLGMLCAIFTCTILLGVYMMETFPNTPMMWKAYAFPVGVSGILGVLYAAWMFYSGSGPSAGSADSKSSSCGSSSSAKFERYNSDYRFSSPCQEPLLSRRSSTLFPDSLMQSSHGKAGARTIELRVREPASGCQSYRRVVVSHGPKQMFPAVGSSANSVSFQDVERAVCSKFSSGMDHGEGYQRIKMLEREKDMLEICDDDDVIELRNGDRLQVTFHRGLDSV